MMMLFGPRHEADTAELSRAELAATVTSLRQILDNGSDAFLATDASGIITEWNGTAEGLLGWSRDEIIGRSVFDTLIEPHRQSEVRAEYREIERTGSSPLAEVPVETVLRHRDGSTVFVETIRREVEIGGRRMHYAMVRDIRWRREAEWAAARDPLTGLVNRAEFVTQLEQLLAVGDADEPDTTERTALVLIDIDGFQRVNDLIGTHAGDQVLKKLASRIAKRSGATDLAARLSGDQFGVLMTLPVGAQDLRRRVSVLADALARRVRVGETKVVVDVSIGAAHFGPKHIAGSPYIRDTETVWQEAELALGSAKRVVGTRVEIYDETDRTGTIERRQRGAELRAALGRGEFEMYYQPVFHALTRQIMGVEALIRWNHPERGLIGPDAFIPLAEEIGLIDDLSEWTCTAILDQLASWQARPQSGPCIGWNLSATQFADPDFVDRLAEAAVDRAVDLSRHKLCVEVTETVFIDRPKAAGRILARLREMGVGVALDDFGTGYSSLAYLKDLPLDALKIDRSFVAGLPDNGIDRAIAGVTVQLARALDVDVIAEGVETTEQLEAVVSLGCTSIQGYLMARPEPIGALEARLAAPAVP